MTRRTLTRDQIVRAAIELLDADGLDGLSMRRLGTYLGTAATAVYWHVGSKDELVVLAGDEVFSELELPDPQVLGWREAALRMALELYAVRGRHPWLLPAMSSHVIFGPGKARFDDHNYAIYETAGFAGVELDRAITTVVMFVIGTAVTESAIDAWRTRLEQGDDPDAAMEAAATEAAATAAQFPRLRARLEAGDLGGQGAEPEEDFRFGLETILDGLATRASTGRRQG